MPNETGMAGCESFQRGKRGRPQGNLRFLRRFARIGAANDKSGDMRGINTGSSDFADLRKTNAIYVDKTAFIHRMISDEGNKVLFISRPRRFGKSLTISALKYLFQGRRDLFTGLAIDKTDWQWRTHPVIHFRFSELRTESVEAFDEDFSAYVATRLRNAGYDYDEKRSYSQNFANAIETLCARSVKDHESDPEHKGEGVVILIDEYDAPVGHSLDDIAKAEAIRARMSSLYAQMKDRTGCIRFLLMTGISKFTKLSVFSALSNIVDVSQRKEYATMYGYTEEEISANFEEHLRAHAKIMGKPYEDYRAELKHWYNGFRFATSDPTTVYNPISIALTLSAKEPSGFSATWATTGRPSMLMNYLRREDVLRIDPERMKGVSEAEFDVADLRNLRPVAMLQQAGYLTFKDYNPLTRLYTLGVPDEEVRRDLCTLMTGVAANENMQWASSLGAKLLSEQWNLFFEGLKALYAGMAYGSTETSVHENSFGRCLSFLLASCGFAFRMEAVQASGRADIVADHPALTCIFELKIGEPVDAAFSQIREKGYAEPYLASGKPIWLIGLSFDRESRKLVDCAAKPYV